MKRLWKCGLKVLKPLPSDQKANYSTTKHFSFFSFFLFLFYYCRNIEIRCNWDSQVKSLECKKRNEMRTMSMSKADGIKDPCHMMLRWDRVKSDWGKLGEEAVVVWVEEGRKGKEHLVTGKQVEEVLSERHHTLLGARPKENDVQTEM